LWLGRRFPFNTQAEKAKDIHEAESRAKNYKAFCLNLFRESSTYRSGKLGHLHGAGRCDVWKMGSLTVVTGVLQQNQQFTNYDDASLS